MFKSITLGVGLALAGLVAGPSQAAQRTAAPESAALHLPGVTLAQERQGRLHRHEGYRPHRHRGGGRYHTHPGHLETYPVPRHRPRGHRRGYRDQLLRQRYLDRFDTGYGRYGAYGGYPQRVIVVPQPQYQVGHRLHDAVVLRDPHRYGLRRYANYATHGGYVYAYDRETARVLALIGLVSAILR